MRDIDSFIWLDSCAFVSFANNPMRFLHSCRFFEESIVTNTGHSRAIALANRGKILVK